MSEAVAVFARNSDIVYLPSPIEHSRLRESAEMDGNQRAPVTDSPWFWALAFSLMALLALAVVSFSGKYGRRQAIEELKYQARSRVAEKLAAENNREAEARINSSESQRAYATPDSQLIPIWPLAALLGLVSAVAAGMLYRSRIRHGSTT